jgi:hypothetical protein
LATIRSPSPSASSVETSATEAPFMTTTLLGALSNVSFIPQLSRVTG